MHPTGRRLGTRTATGPTDTNQDNRNQNDLTRGAVMTTTHGESFARRRGHYPSRTW